VSGLVHVELVQLHATVQLVLELVREQRLQVELLELIQLDWPILEVQLSELQLVLGWVQRN
jgi:hypothetical protein